MQDIICILNQELFEQVEKFYLNTGICFSLETNGFCTSVIFADFSIWCSENDERKYIEEIEEYEPLEDFIRRETQKIINELSKVTFIEVV